MKKEMEVAFKRMKKEFPGRGYALELHYQTWRSAPNYYAYLESTKDKSGFTTIGDTHETPDEAVDSIIKQRKEDLETKLKEGDQTGETGVI